MTLIDSAPRWLTLEGLVNARSVVPGVLLRSDNLQSLTEDDVRMLVEDAGVETVIDLRTDVEVDLEGPGPMTRVAGVRIEHRSLYPDSGGNTDLELDTLRPWRALPAEDHLNETPVVQAYLNYLQRRPDSIVGSIRTIARAERAVLVHCAAGKDRTGVVVAMALDAVGCDRDLVVADYAASAQRIDAILGRLRSSPTYRAELEGREAADLAPTSATMERFLQIIDDRLGGTLGWLSESGFDSADLDRLRERLLPA